MRREQGGPRVEGNTPASFPSRFRNAATQRDSRLGLDSILWRAPRCRRRAHEDVTVTTLLRPTSVSPRLPDRCHHDPDTVQVPASLSWANPGAPAGPTGAEGGGAFMQMAETTVKSEDVTL